MILVTVRIMLPVFNPLILFFQFNLFIGNTVLIYIIFFFDLGLGGSLCQSFFVFLFNLCKFLLMLLQCLFLFRYTTCLNCIIILVKIIFEIIFCFPDQFLIWSLFCASTAFACSSSFWQDAISESFSPLESVLSLLRFRSCSGT